ncbi:Tail-specific protease, partial [Pseudomonas syringae pv. maculicola]
PAIDPFKPFLAQLQSRHEARSSKDAEFVFIEDRLALAKKLMNEKTVSLNEADRRAEHASIEGKQLALENTRRKAKGEEPLKELAKALKQRCGTGGSLKDDVIEIQGDHVELLIAELVKKGFKAKKSGG